jgi:rhamnosyltransferase subunit B
MRILLSAMGTAGDLDPFVALGRELLSRDHRVAMVTNEAAAEGIQAKGIDVVPFGPPLDSYAFLESDPKYMHPFFGLFNVWRDAYLPMVVPTFRTTLDRIDAQRPDVLVVHPFSFGSMWAAQARDVPVAVLYLAPVSFCNRKDEIKMLPWQLPRWLNRGLFAVGRNIRLRLLSQTLRASCEQLSVAWHRDIVALSWFESEIALGLWSRHVRDALPGDPESGLICGYPAVRGDDSALDADLEAFLATGPPPVLMSLGTTAERFATDLYDFAVEICAEIGQRIVLLGTKYRTARPQLPGHALACAYAPHASIMPRCSLIIHHGGAGSTLAAQRSGCPTLIIPFAHDQFDNANRAKRLGVSLTLRRADASRVRLKRAFTRLLEEEDFAQRANALGAAIAKEPDGVRVACDAIEQTSVPRLRRQSVSIRRPSGTCSKQE